MDAPQERSVCRDVYYIGVIWINLLTLARKASIISPRDVTQMRS